MNEVRAIVPFSAEYHALRAEFVSQTLDSQVAMRAFELGHRLPPGYGVGFDERVVEYPWALAQNPSGRILDAGSSLNYSFILERLVPFLTNTYIATLTPEPQAFTEQGISYVYCDLRDLPLRNDLIDTIVSISTIEHVGMDNIRYGALASAEADPDRAALQVADEFRRVLAPGGRILVTVPYGQREDLGWMRQFDRETLERFVEALAPSEVAISVFGYSLSGWQVSTLDSSADARYRDTTVDKEPVHDLAVAARAVACVRATL